MSVGKYVPRRRLIRNWMILGVILIFFQIVIGGVTRLTGSGLSITKWEVVTGIVPPLNSDDWQQAFDLYQDTPQYKKLNDGMSLSEFKFIYFWEYLHRLWARSMGFIFIFPFLFFVYKRWLSKEVIKKLIVVFLLAGLVGLFGWIMVASGLTDRPWVNAYKLSIHLCLALLVMGYLLWILLGYWYGEERIGRLTSIRNIFILVCVQIFLGGMMSGMKASLVFPDFPDYHGRWIPEILLDLSAWNVDNIVNYDKTPFAPALVQFFHRNTGYILIISYLWLFFKYRKHWKLTGLTVSSTMLVILLITQMVLGIMVLLDSISVVPVLWGVLHQMVAILIFVSSLYLYFFSVNTDGESVLSPKK